MSDRYCYADLKEMISQLSFLSGESEGIATDMIQAVSELIGFEGEAAEAVRPRFSEQYTEIRAELIEVRQGIFQKLQTVLNTFLEIDNSTDAVICYNRRDDIGYEAYRKNQMIVLELIQEYRPAIVLYEAMSAEEKRMKYPLQGGNPSGELLFLSQLHNCSRKHRKAILEELKKGKGINEEALKRILGDTVLIPALDPRAALITIAYNASRLDMSMAEAMKEAEYQQVNQVLQFMDTMMLSGMKGMMEHRSNPLPSYESLNLDVRLDLAEMKAWDGFKNYDYIPIAPESLAKTRGEVIPSLNAVLAEGAGEAELGRITREVEIVDAKGKCLGELDEIDLNDKIFYEDKTAKGLETIHPKTGKVQQTPEQFADKQIYTKTQKRIINLQEATSTREAKTNIIENVATIEELREIKEFVFRLDGDSPDLIEAVEGSLNKLRMEFPDYKFSATFGN